MRWPWVGRSLLDEYRALAGQQRNRIAELEAELRRQIVEYTDLTHEMIRMRKLGFESVKESLAQEPVEREPLIPHEIGSAILQRLPAGSTAARHVESWALARLGAGVPPDQVADEILEGGDVEGALFDSAMEVD